MSATWAAKHSQKILFTLGQEEEGLEDGEHYTLTDTLLSFLLPPFWPLSCLLEG